MCAADNPPCNLFNRADAAAVLAAYDSRMLASVVGTVAQQQQLYTCIISQPSQLLSNSAHHAPEELRVPPPPQLPPLVQQLR
jgi:hypothetical protein